MCSNIEIQELYEQYQHDIYHFVWLRTGDHFAAEDIVQETFLKAIKNMHHFKGNSSYKTWLLSIARNTVYDYLRWRKIRRWVMLNDATQHHQQHNNENPTPTDILEKKYEATIIHAALMSLKPNYRDVIILRRIKELTIQETADVLHWSESKVKNVLARATKALKQELDRSEGGEYIGLSRSRQID